MVWRPPSSLTESTILATSSAMTPSSNSTLYPPPYQILREPDSLIESRKKQYRWQGREYHLIEELAGVPEQAVLCLQVLIPAVHTPEWQAPVPRKL